MLPASCAGADPRRDRRRVRRPASRRRAGDRRPALGAMSAASSASRCCRRRSRRRSRSSSARRWRWRSRAARSFPGRQPLHRGAQSRERAAGDRRRVRHRRGARPRRLGRARGCALVGIDPGGWLYGLPGILIAHVFFNAPLAARVFLASLAAVPGEHWRLAAQLGMGPARDLSHPRLAGPEARGAGDRGADLPPLLHELRDRARARRRTGRGDARGGDLRSGPLRRRFRARRAAGAAAGRDLPGAGACRSSGWSRRPGESAAIGRRWPRARTPDRRRSRCSIASSSRSARSSSCRRSPPSRLSGIAALGSLLRADVVAGDRDELRDRGAGGCSLACSWRSALAVVRAKPPRAGRSIAAAALCRCPAG